MAPSSRVSDQGLVFSGAVMSTMEPLPSSRSHGTSKVSSRSTTEQKHYKSGNSSTPTPPHILMDLKQRILASLAKISDRDTQQIGLEELEKIMESITAPDSISVCLSCLYDSEMQQKSVVKKECVRLFGSLASSEHADLLVPHLVKIIASIMRRLRDPDSSVRDACVDAISVLSARMLSSASTSVSSPISSLSLSPLSLEKENGAHNASSVVTLATFTKPLFDALSEQNKSVQTGAAMCLSRVIESAKPPPVGPMARLCPRICKFMSNPNFLARPALLAVIGSLSQVGALGQQQLGLVMPCVHEALESSDWATRKAAAETLTRVGNNLGPALLSFRSATLQVLESCRFDKVKPVRDTVHDAIQLWKALTGTELESLESAKTPDNSESTNGMQKLELRSLSPVPKLASPNAAEGLVKGNKSSPRRMQRSAEKPVEAIRRRASTLGDKKLNPEFFQKIAARDSDDWQIEVVLPRSSSQMSNPEDVCAGDGVAIVDDAPIGRTTKEEKSAEGSELSTVLTSTADKSQFLTDTENSVMEKGSGKADCDAVWKANIHVTNVASTSSFETNNGRSTWVFIEERLCQLEQQQSSLLQMFEGYLACTDENMFILQSRLRDLEHIVEDLASESQFFGGKRLSSGVMRTNYGLKLHTRYNTPGSEYVNSGFGKSVNEERVSASEHINKSLRSSMYRSSEPHPRDWDGFAHRGFRDELSVNGTNMVDPGMRRRGSTDVLSRSEKEEFEETEEIRLSRAWERVPGAFRLGEGPSARSVWQASKDEATLAAIRVAGEDAEPSDAESLSSAASRPLLNEMASENLPQKFSSGRDGKGYWSLWGSAMEFVRTGDLESAYNEVLCADDDLMLMRLMTRTGPVLDQLTTSTVAEVLHVVGQLLQQQNYFDYCLAWIQQVANMVGNNGPECFDLTRDSKKELLTALQESSGMELPDGWIGSSIDELIHQLSSAWSIDL